MTLASPADAPARTGFSPLLNAILERHAYRRVDEATLDAVAGAHPIAMLLVSGDWWRLAECDDLAVIVPELDKALDGQVAVLVAEREAERALQRRFRFASFPALVFLREGAYLGAMEGARLGRLSGRTPRNPGPRARGAAALPHALGLRHPGGEA
jgi:hydrogenase-1 operon protein HyaE